MSRVLRATILCALTLVGVVGCRALTEPDLRPQTESTADLVEGRALGPNGEPLAGGEIRIFNHEYVEDREDLIDLVVALDDEGRFSLRTDIRGRVDVRVVARPWFSYPNHVVLGLTREDLPWLLIHPMREVEIGIELPETLLDRLEGGSLRVEQNRPRPAGAHSFHDSYSIPIDSTARARGWALPGMHDVRVELDGRDGWGGWMRYDDSLRVLTDPPLTLRPRLREQSLELVLPEGLPARAEFDVNFHGTSLPGDLPWEGTFEFPVGDPAAPIREFAPPVVTRLFVQARNVTLMTQTSWDDGVDLPLGAIETLEIGRYWLELALAPQVALPDRYIASLRAGYESGSRFFDDDGRALFLMDEGTYLLEVFESFGWAEPSELVHRRTVEVEGSQVLYVDF